MSLDLDDPDNDNDDGPDLVSYSNSEEPWGDWGENDFGNSSSTLPHEADSVETDTGKHMDSTFERKHLTTSFTSAAPASSSSKSGQQVPGNKPKTCFRFSLQEGRMQIW